MSMRSTNAWPMTDDVLPFVTMLMIICSNMAVMTVVKAAMNEGMDSIVFVIYHNTLGTFILLPFFIIHILRNNIDRPPLTFRHLFKFFILGLFGLSLFPVLLNIGISYSSPTMVSAISNLSPGATFLTALIFRMEKIDMRSSSSVAKLVGTMIATSGAMVLTLYQGPSIFHSINSSDQNQILLPQPSNWILGGLITFTAGIFGCLWTVLQTATAREYQDQQTIVFFSCLFGTLQCVALTPFLNQNRSIWVLTPGIKLTAIVLGAVYTTAIHNNVVTWCLRKKGPVYVAMFSPLSIALAVIMGVTFLGESLHLGSAIGAIIIAIGFYTVMWGQTKETINIPIPMLMSDELDISNNAPLLSSKDNKLDC
ncbi:hypothetical protein QVD17_04660 [Tagetes erecta]|uniref:WAT1-related protein n=1 Tax=Tagetes erecta TaxID=13708 RepID=A0AAD8LFX7_TARER|nr:hypothetical protein QVD17_04660 [Tagetes erecta]